jgi:UDP-glucose 4-epimerase
MKEQNVIGTMQLLAACQQAPQLKRLVMRSSTAAYGASFRDPAVFTEDTEPREVPRGGYARDILDIEGYVRGFRRRRPDVAATVLRFAPFIGPSAETALRRAGRIALPILEPGLTLAAAAGRGISQDQIDLFVYGRVVDISLLVAEFGFTPRSTPEAFEDFVHTHAPGSSLTPERLAAAEKSFLETIHRVRREVRS